MRSVVRMKGLEPPRLSALDPKSSAATNYATSANCGAKIQFFSIGNSILEFFFYGGYGRLQWYLFVVHLQIITLCCDELDICV